MLDFRQETRAEMVGLHLDLVRMGRGWCREMRAAMQEYVGDLKELWEENRKLREENERLRRWQLRKRGTGYPIVNTCI